MTLHRAVPWLVILALGAVAACGKKPDGPDPTASALTASAAPIPPPVFPSPLLASGAPVSFAPIVKAADPAVVTITTVGEQIVPGWGGKTRRREAKGLGTGFIIDKDGTIITNNHVVSQEDGSVATTISVKLSDDRELPCTVVGRDPPTDIAVVRIDPKGLTLPVLALGDSDAIEVGDWVVAIGNPFGLAHTVSAGIISAKDRTKEDVPLDPSGYYDFMQTDASINPGNSGGPLVNIRGEVIGINSAIASQTGYYSGYGFAIPITLAKTVMDDIIVHGRVRRGIVGVGLNEVTAEDAAVNKLAVIGGAKVGNFNPPENNPAQKAGIMEGDLIIKADGKTVDRVSTLQRIIRSHQPGDVVELEAVRYGDRKTFRVKLGEAPNDEKAVASAAREGGEKDASAAAVAAKKLGISVEPISTDAGRAAARVSVTQHGVLVTEVTRGGPAEGRLAPNFVITDVIFPEPKLPINSVADLQRALAKFKDGDYVGLKILTPPDGNGVRSTAVVNLRVGG